jgi:phosphoribosylanthranilate isomerase
LAGGLSADNVKEAAALVRPYMIDASSSLETDGKKDVKKIKEFIEKVKESQHA